jgi:hypothetical protein
MIRRALAACLVAVMPAVAGAEIDAGLAATLRVCTEPGPSLVARIDSLADAGWLTQSDNPAGRDRYALYTLLRRYSDFPPGDQKLREMFERGRSGPLEPLPEPGGQVPTAANVIAELEKRGIGGFQYELPDQSSSLLAELHLQGDDGKSVMVRCSLMLGPVLAPDAITALVPAGNATVTKDESWGGAPGTLWHVIRVEGANDSFRLHIDHVELSTSEGFTALLADARSNTPLSAIITTALTNVPLR